MSFLSVGSSDRTKNKGNKMEATNECYDWFLLNITDFVVPLISMVPASSGTASNTSISSGVGAEGTTSTLGSVSGYWAVGSSLFTAFCLRFLWSCSKFLLFLIMDLSFLTFFRSLSIFFSFFLLNTMTQQRTC